MPVTIYTVSTFFVNHNIQSTRLFHDSLNEVSALELLKMPKDLETITFGRHFNELRWQSRVVEKESI